MVQRTNVHSEVNYPGLRNLSACRWPIRQVGPNGACNCCFVNLLAISRLPSTPYAPHRTREIPPQTEPNPNDHRASANHDFKASLDIRISSEGRGCPLQASPASICPFDPTSRDPDFYVDSMSMRSWDIKVNYQWRLIGLINNEQGHDILHPRLRFLLVVHVVLVVHIPRGSGSPVFGHSPSGIHCLRGTRIKWVESCHEIPSFSPRRTSPSSLPVRIPSPWSLSLQSSPLVLSSPALSLHPFISPTSVVAHCRSGSPSQPQGPTSLNVSARVLTPVVSDHTEHLNVVSLTVTVEVPSNSPAYNRDYFNHWITSKLFPTHPSFFRTSQTELPLSQRFMQHQRESVYNSIPPASY